MNPVEAQILDIDGSCRDITFSYLSPTGVLGLFDNFGTSYVLEKASDRDGRQVTVKGARHYLADSSSGIFHSTWASGDLISYLQLFFSWEDRERYFAEVTFFPQDILVEQFCLTRFIEFLRVLGEASGATEYYVRYENASWKFGDTGEMSGVILSSSALPVLS